MVIMGLKGWVTDPWGSLKKVLTTSFIGEVPVGCGPQDLQHIEMGFIGNTSAKLLINSLEKYNIDVKSKNQSGASGSYSIDQGAISFGKKAVVLLKAYHKELGNFKKIDFFSDSTLKRLELTKEKMREILKKLKVDSEKALKNYSDNSMREAALKIDELKGYVPKRIWADFIQDMIADIKTTENELDSAIDLKKPEIKFDVLQIPPVKVRIGKKEIERKKIIEENIRKKLEKDTQLAREKAESAKKKVENDLKEAEKIHVKVKTNYKTLDSAKTKALNIGNVSDISHLEWRLEGFYNYCVDICRLMGTDCCKEGGEAPDSRPSDGSIIKIKEAIEKAMKNQSYPGVAELALKADADLKAIKKLEKDSQQAMKEIQGLLAKAAKKSK